MSVLLAGTAAAQCPAAADMVRGVVIDFDNRTGTYRQMADGFVLSSAVSKDDGKVSETLLYRGLVPIRATLHMAGGGAVIEDISYGMDTSVIDAILPFAPGGAAQARNVHTDAVTGATQLVDFGIEVVGETTVTIAGCRYDALTVKLDFAGSGGAYRAEVVHLTELGLSFVVADAAIGADIERFTPLSIVLAKEN